MTRALRTILQLLIVLLWALLCWRYRDLSWGELALQGAFFAALLLMVSALGSRFVSGDYELPPACAERVSAIVMLAGLGLPLLMWSPGPLLILPLWWGLLMAYLTHPAGSDFAGLRQHFRALGQQGSGVVSSLKRATIAFAFWPVFVPKAIWVWGFLLLAALWLLRGALPA